MTLKEKLKSIRDLLDVNTVEVDTDSVANHAQQLASMIGLSAECKSEAKKELEWAKLKAMNRMEQKKISPSILSKRIDAECADELGVYEYADRLNAGIVHKLDTMRTIISLRKQELENSKFAH